MLFDYIELAYNTKLDGINYIITLRYLRSLDPILLLLAQYMPNDIVETQVYINSKQEEDPLFELYVKVPASNSLYDVFVP